jgi:hypothetical protein
MDRSVRASKESQSRSGAVSLYAGSAFGSASTLVAQLGILFGMLASKQPLLPLIVAAASSAISGSFGDAFSMFVSETTALSPHAVQTSLSVFLSKLALGAVFILAYSIIGNRPPLLLLFAITFSTFLLLLLSYTIPDTPELCKGVLQSLCVSKGARKHVSKPRVFLCFTLLTASVVTVTSMIGVVFRSLSA